MPGVQIGHEKAERQVHIEPGVAEQTQQEEDTGRGVRNIVSLI